MISATATPIAVLMGPQRLAPTVGQALDLIEARGRVALITAGWQEREAEDEELVQALGGRPAVNLRLHARGDAIFRDDPELFELHRAKQDRLRQLQELYRRRLAHVNAAARQMQALEEDAEVAPRELVAPHAADAIDALRRLDDEHARYVDEVEAAFEAGCRPADRPAVQRRRQEVMALVAGCGAVAIAGGHVAVLLNKLRLFGLHDVLSRIPLVAWSAGAMVLTERIVLFHDSPPQGRGNPELLGRGLGLFPGLVALPHARRRLLLDDARRVALFARRFAPARCVALDERSYLALGGAKDAWRASAETRLLTPDGACVSMEAL